MFGVLFSEKVVGGVFSIVINLIAIFSVMFMPLDNMNKVINNIAYSLPFANILGITNGSFTNNSELIYSIVNFGVFFIIGVIATLIVLHAN